MRVYERGQSTPQMWGKDQIVLTIEDITDLLKGKKLWTTVCSEYAVEIICEEEDNGWPYQQTGGDNTAYYS